MNNGESRHLQLFGIQVTESLPEIFVVEHLPNHLRHTTRRIWSSERVILRAWLDLISNVNAMPALACSPSSTNVARLPVYTLRLPNVQSTRLLRSRKQALSFIVTSSPRGPAGSRACKHEMAVVLSDIYQRRYPRPELHVLAMIPFPIHDSFIYPNRRPTLLLACLKEPRQYSQGNTVGSAVPPICLGDSADDCVQVPLTPSHLHLY